MGTAHEQPESTGRGTGADGTDLQLSFFDAHIPTEAQQIETIDQAESEKTPSAFVLSQAEIENELRKHGSGFEGGKQRIMALYQTQPDRNLRAKALAKEYGIGGHSHDFLDGSRGFVNHDWKGLEFDHYPDHQKITLKWTQVEKYIDLMIQSDRYLTDKEKEHYTPPVPVNAEPDGALNRAKNLIRDFCLEEYDSEPDYSDLTKIDIAYTHATDEDIPIIYVKSVWKRCTIGLPGSSNLIRRKASRTSRLRPIIMWTRLFFKLPLQHGGIYGIAVPRFASWYPPSIGKSI